MGKNRGFFRESFPSPGGYVQPEDKNTNSKTIGEISHDQKLESTFIRISVLSGIVTVTYNNGVEHKYKGDRVFAKQIYKDGLPINNPMIYIDDVLVGEAYDRRLISINGAKIRYNESQEKERSNCRCAIM